MDPRRFLNRRFLQGLALVALAAGTYTSAVDNPFVYDDVLAVSGNLMVRTPQVGWAFFFGATTSTGFANGQFRPLPMLTFAANNWATGIAPRGFRLTNLALHIVVCLLAAMVLRRILRTFPLRAAGRPLDDREADWASFLGAALLAVHPAHSLVVLLVWKRATLLAGIFSLTALACLLRLRRMGEDGDRQPSRSDVWLYVGMYGSHLLALASKETAVVLPALLLLVDSWPRGDGATYVRSRPRSRFALHAPLWMLSLIVAGFLYPHAATGAELSPLQYLAVQAKVVWFYVATLVAPTLLSAAYSVDIPSGLDPWAIAGGLALLAAVAASVRLAKTMPLPTLCVLWAVIALLPTSSLFPIPLLVDEDRIYLSTVLPWGAAGAAALVLARHGKRTRAIVATVTTLALLSAAMITLDRGVLWSSPELVWLNARLRYPTSYHANVNLCVALGNTPGRHVQALAVCKDALAHFPASDAIRESFVRTLAESGRFDEAEAVLAECLRRNPESSRCLRVAGHLAWARNRPAEAIRYYEHALRGLALDETVALYLASSYAAVGRQADAMHMALQLARWPAPADPIEHLRLLDLYRSIGWRDRACAGFRAVRPAVMADPRLRSTVKDLDATCAR